MTRHLWRWPALTLLCGSVGCLLYTDRINVSPTVKIAPPSDPISRGGNVTFHAEARDDQSVSALTYSWGAIFGVCPAGGVLPPPGPSLLSGAAASFDITLDTSGDYCAFVEVTDAEGAVGHDTYTFHIVDRPPVPSITQLEGPAVVAASSPSPPIPLFSALRFSGQASVDPDPGDAATYFAWALTRPDGSLLMPPPECPEAVDDVCFEVDQPGSYLLLMVVYDNEGTSATKTLSFQVAADRPPCIVETAPPFSVPSPGHDPEGPLTLRVAKVVDDGDPLPAPSDRPSTSSFVWSWRVGTTAAFTRVVNLDLPQLDFPAQSFVSGQTVQVRVEAHDRVARVADLLQCVQADPQPLICDAGDGCARWVTWTLGFQ